MDISLKEKIKLDLNQSRKSGDKIRTETLKMVLSQIQYGESSSPAPVSDLESVKRYRKSLQKALDVVATPQLQDEIKIVEEYLRVDDSQLLAAVQLVRELRTAASTKGSLMKDLKSVLHLSSDVKLAAIDEALKTPYEGA